MCSTSYTPTVEFRLVASGILAVLIVRASEIVSTGEIFLSTHIQVIMGLTIEDSLDGGRICGTDRTGRETTIGISIIRRCDLKMGTANTFDREIMESEADGRVSLEGHIGI